MNKVSQAGLPSTVEGLIQLYNFRMPEFSWLSLEQNRKSARIGAVQALFVSTSIDRTIHVSPQRRLALVRVHEGTMFIFFEKENGLK